MRGADAFSAAGRTRIWSDTKLGIGRFSDKSGGGTATCAVSDTDLTQRQCRSFSLIKCTFHITSDKEARGAPTCLSALPLLVYIHSAAPLRTFGTGLDMQAIQLGPMLLDHRIDCVIVS
jgi:hypothetical protein